MLMPVKVKQLENKILKEIIGTSFYLTEDSHRLYIGNSDGTVALLNSAIAFYATLSELQSEASKPQFKPADGDLAFIGDKNALVIYKNGTWNQINSQEAVKALAEAAQAAANTAQQAADAAQQTADGAASAAAAAGTAASNAQQTANTAVANAATAQAAAEGAQQTANTAVANAATAQAAAEGAQQTADNAKTIAERAEGKADINATAITTLRTEIGNIANIMNFRGPFDALEDITNPAHGDVAIVDGVEYVYVETTTPSTEEEGDPVVTGVWEAFGAATANEARFKAIEDAATELEGRVTALDKATDGRVAVVEGVASENTTAINTEKGRIDTLVNTTIPGIEAKIGTVAANTNLAELIANEVDRASGVEDDLNDRLDTLETTTIPGISTAHNALADRVTALDQASTGRVAVAETEINTLKTKTGIASLTGNDTLYGLITAETSRATGEEAKIRGEFAAADAALESKITAQLTWGTFN